MGLIPLKLAGALQPVDIRRSRAIATPAPIREPVKSTPSLPTEAPASSFKSPRKILRIKAMRSTPLPYGDDQWRKLLDEVKELFQKGLFKKCSDRCVAALEQVRGPVHPTHLTYLSFYAAVCISIQAQPLQVKNPQKLVLLKLSLSFYERAEGFLIQAKMEQAASNDRPAKQEYKLWKPTSPARSRTSSVDSTASTTNTSILDFPLSSHDSENESSKYTASAASTHTSIRSKSSSIDSITSERPATKDYKNLLYGSLARSGTPADLSTPANPLRVKREYKRSESGSSAHSNSSSIDSAIDDSIFSLPCDSDSRRSSASSYTSISSKMTLEDAAPQKVTKPIAPIRLLKPAPRSRKRVAFAPSLPTIISDGCINGSATNVSEICPIVISTPPPPAPRPLPTLPLRPALGPISSNIQTPATKTSATKTPNSRVAGIRTSSIPTTSSPVVPTPNTPCPAPSTIHRRRRRPLPPLPLTIRPPHAQPRPNFNFSKPRPTPPSTPSPPSVTTVEAISIFLLSQTRGRYNTHLLSFLSRIKHHMTGMRVAIADVQFKRAVLEADGPPPARVKTISIRELRAGTGWAQGVRWKVEPEEIVRRVRKARLKVLKRRGEQFKAWEAERYEELCRMALDELGS